MLLARNVVFYIHKLERRNIDGLDCLLGLGACVPYNNLFFKANEYRLRELKKLGFVDQHQFWCRYIIICGNPLYLEKVIKRWNWWLREWAPKGRKYFVWKAPFVMFTFRLDKNIETLGQARPRAVVFFKTKPIKYARKPHEEEFFKIDRGKLIAKSAKEYVESNNITPSKDFEFEFNEEEYEKQAQEEFEKVKEDIENINEEEAMKDILNKIGIDMDEEEEDN